MDKPIFELRMTAERERKPFYHLNGSGFFGRGELLGNRLAKDSFCPECISLYPNVGPFDLHIKGKLHDVPLAKPGGIHVAIIHRKFLDQLGHDRFRELFHLGKIFDQQEKELIDYHSFHGKKGVFHVRGGPTSWHHFCEKCGRRVYIPMGKKGEVYLLKQKLPEHPISHSNWNQLIVAASVYEKIDWSVWKKKPYVVELPIRDQPDDGINEIF